MGGHHDGSSAADIGLMSLGDHSTTDLVLHAATQDAVFPSWKLRIRQRGLFDLVDVDIIRPADDSRSTSPLQHPDGAESGLGKG